MSEKARVFEFKVRDRIYAVITPCTPHCYLERYAPKPYFVLETFVLEVSMSGRVIFDTDYYIDRSTAFKCLDEAKKQLTLVFNAETGGVLDVERVRVVTHEEEQNANSNLNRSIVRSIASYK